MPRNHVRIALVFPVHDHDLALSRLQKGLEKACEVLPFLKGRIFNEPHDRNLLSISWDTSHPAPTIEQQPTPVGYPTYAQLLADRGSTKPYAFSLFPFMDRGRENTEEGAPVFGAAYVKTEGGMILFMSMHHNVMDGPGFGEFVKLWANSASLSIAPVASPDPHEVTKRKAKILEQLPAWLKERTSLFTLKDILKKHGEYTIGAPPIFKQPTSSFPVPAIPSSSSIFRFSRRKLAEVKSDLESSLDPSSLTVNNVLCAVIWSHISHVRRTRSHDADASTTSRLGFAVNGRRVLNLFDPPYLGNAAFLAQAEFTMSEFRAPSNVAYESLAPVIKTIATATRRIDAAHIAELTQLSGLVPSLSELIFGWNILGGPHLSITSWAELGMYDADFGGTLGKPIMVRVPDVPRDGLVIVLPRKRGDGEDEVIEAAVYLREDDANRLNRDDAWRSWLV